MLADEICGTWVCDYDMHPVTNVWGRKWMTKDGELHGTYYGPYTIPVRAYQHGGIMWHFPNEKSPRR